MSSMMTAVEGAAKVRRAGGRCTRKVEDRLRISTSSQYDRKVQTAMYHQASGVNPGTR